MATTNHPTPRRTEGQARHDKAEAIANLLQVTGVDSGTARLLEGHSWRLAARCAWHVAAAAGTAPRDEWVDASPATRRLVITELARREQESRTAEDVFAAIAAGTALTAQPRTVEQDVDAWYGALLAALIDRADEALACALIYRKGDGQLALTAYDSLVWETKRTTGATPAEAADWALTRPEDD